MRNSGQLLILAMFLVAFAAAGASWWFRYSATHQAAQFWGPEAAQLIRDAPQVELLALQVSDAASKATDDIRIGGARWKVVARRDISAAPGLTHLRNALLEDRSFTWGPFLSDHDEQWTTAILFRESVSSEPLTILFLPSFARALVSRPGGDHSQLIGTQPISAGLAETINDWSQLPASP